MTPHAAAAPQTGLVVPAVPAWLTRAAVTDAYSVAEGLYNAGHTTPDAVARLIANAAHIASQVAWDQMRIVPTDPNHGPYVDAFVAAFRRRLEALAQSTPPLLTHPQRADARTAGTSDGTWAAIGLTELGFIRPETVADYLVRAEPMAQSCADEWAKAQPWASPQERAEYVEAWVQAFRREMARHVEA